MNKGNAANLTGYPRNTEEARARGKVGGVASGESRRKKRSLREAARMLLSTIAEPTDETRHLLEGLTAIDVQSIALAAQARHAMDGDLKALVFLRDTAGEYPGKEYTRDNPFAPKKGDPFAFSFEPDESSYIE